MSVLVRVVQIFLCSAVTTVLGVCTASAQPFPDNLPCSTRRDYDSCFAECTGDNYLLECACLWHSSDENSHDCPEGETCCFNMPCEVEDDQSGFECLRTGGSPDGITPKHCQWTQNPPGDPGGTCRCVPPLVNAGYTIQMLAFLDPLVVWIPPFDCTCPYTTNEQWLRLDVCNPPGVRKLEIKLDFAKPANDSIVLEGSLNVPAGFVVNGAALIANIGGISKGFTLDAKGKAKVGTDQVQLTVKSNKGVVNAQAAKLTIRFEKGSLASSLVDDGLVNQTVTNKAVSVPVEIELAGTMFAKTHAQSYTAKAGKTGRAK